MAAAGWVQTAVDITNRSDVWKHYLTIGQLVDRIDLGENTVRDLLTRKCAEDDPRWAIRWPAARMGGSRPAGVGAEPMWTEAQADDYNHRAAERERERKAEIEADRALPVVSSAQAVERGLATVAELCEILDRPKSTISRWMREWRGSDTPFPPKVGQAERVAPFTNMGPPRPLYVISEVQAFVRYVADYEDRYGGGRGRRRADLPAAV